MPGKSNFGALLQGSNKLESSTSKKVHRETPASACICETIWR